MTTDEETSSDFERVPFSVIEECFNSLIRRSNAAPLEDFSGLS